MNDFTTNCMVAKIEELLMQCYAVTAEPSEYNRFHINRIKDFIAKRPAYYNENESTRRYQNAHWTDKERLNEIANEFANMIWDRNFNSDFNKKEIKFKKEITSIEKALLWCEIAEVQLVPKGLMSPKEC